MNVKKLVLCLVAVMLLMSSATVFAAQEKKVSVGFNNVTVKVNGTLFKGNNIFYDGTTYVPVRNISALLKFPVHYYAATKTSYIGTIPDGEVPDSVLKEWAAIDAKAASTASSDKIEKTRDAKVTVKINDIMIKVNGKKVSSTNLVYNGTTYAPMRAVATMLGIKVYFHEPTSTAYLGTVPKDELTAAPPKKTTNMYNVSATGEMAGWQVLVGHEYASVARIYYQVNGSIIKTKVVDIRKVDYNKKITWTDDKGKKRTNTIAELYDLFAYSNEFTSVWLHNKFGDVYGDWLASSAIQADVIVEQYLKDTGQLDTGGSNVTLTPDAKFIVEEPPAEPDINEILERLEKNGKADDIPDPAVWVYYGQLRFDYKVMFTAGTKSGEYVFYKAGTLPTAPIYTITLDAEFNEADGQVEADGITVKRYESEFYFEIADLKAKGIIS